MKRKSKAFIAAFLSLCLIATTVLVSTGNAFASDANDSNGLVSVSYAQGYEGDTVKVTASYTNNQGTAGFEFRLYYDTDVLELVKTTLSEDVFVEDVVVLGDKNADAKITNFISYAVALTKDNTKNGELYTAEFKIKEGAAIGTSVLKITDLAPSNLAGEYLSVNSVYGSVRVLCKHADTEEVVKEAVTCTKDGVTEVICKKCGDLIDTKTVKSTGHKFGEYEVVTEATCSKDGLKRRTCSVCNEVEEVKIPATGNHTAVTEVTKKATCTTAGEKVTKCSVCDKVLSTEEIPATGHKYSDYVIKKDATETEDGILERTCTVCGETEKVTIPKLESLKTEVKDEKAENPLASQYTKGEDITFTAIGIGMDNVNPQAGDMRYVPAKWSINPSGEWTSAPYTATFAVANAGDYELKVVYNREVYKDGKWVADGVTITSKTAITIAEKAETPDNGNNGNTNNDSTTPSGDASTDNNASVSTGDTSIYVMIMAVIMIMVSAAVIVEKSRKAVK